MHSPAVDAIAGFAGSLRQNGYTVGLGEHAGMLKAALLFSARDQKELCHAWRALVCSNAEDWRRFPELFDAYWFPARRRGSVKSSGVPPRTRDLRQLIADLQAGGEGKGGPAASGGLADRQQAAESSAEGQAQGGASRSEPLEARQNRFHAASDRQRLEQEARLLARQARRFLSRHLQSAHAGLHPDIRSTVRGSLATGGLLLDVAWQRPRRLPPRLFVLVDVSRSMETFAPLFMALADAFRRQAAARVFVFHTRIAEVTPLLRRRSRHMQEQINAVAAGFGSGTRIASSIADLVQRHARGRLGHTHVLVLSDGYDSDSPELLAQELGRCRSRGARIFWLHPTRSFPGAQAMQAAIPHLTAAAPLHDIDSLARLRAVPFWSGAFPWKP
jgi:uncharacterized protein with von Willebrand factor type A (vWA) domain